MKMILVWMNLFFAFTAFSQTTAYDGNDEVKFECDKETVMKYAADGAKKDHGLKPGTILRMKMPPQTSEESFETWLVSVSTKDIAVEYLIPLEKKTTEDGKIVCGIF